MAFPDLLYNITLLSLFTAIVLSVFFLITRKGRRSGNIIMAMLLFLFSLQIFYSFTISNSAYIYFIDWHKPLFLLRQTGLLMGPLIYFYVLSFLKNFEFRPIQLVHAIPFGGLILVLILYNSGPTDFIIWLSPWDLYTTVIILAVNFIYILISFIKLKTVHFSVTEWFNNLKKSSYITWIQYLLISFIILWILNLNISAIWMITQKPEWCSYSRSIYTLTVFIFLGSILLILMLQPAIYYLPGKYKNTPVNDDSMIQYKQALADHMEQTQPYLNPNITLETVAKDISVNPRILSQIINESFKNNFNGYVNEFRIKECLKQLADVKCKKTILEILYDSGFNSKSAFYTEFKKHTSISPQEYRNKCRLDQNIPSG